MRALRLHQAARLYPRRERGQRFYDFGFVPLASLPALTTSTAGEDRNHRRRAMKLNGNQLEFFDPSVRDASGKIVIVRAGRDASGTARGCWRGLAGLLHFLLVREPED